ncbi:D-mannose binding lectin [Nitzschia inconspicua]|uniref:D-mannose binding lectin n=1 Tax=Nitzschia inconspicua TaxID=303405 RepID=A0A9K3K4Q6_9STRA|nr:D-mannose binding lectin [Nitzschia inconspicua]KAG7347656.1 D-mannose binding lectin [Nitzschia inconspicua]
MPRSVGEGLRSFLKTSRYSDTSSIDGGDPNNSFVEEDDNAVVLVGHQSGLSEEEQLKVEWGALLDARTGVDTANDMSAWLVSVISVSQRCANIRNYNVSDDDNDVNNSDESGNRKQGQEHSIQNDPDTRYEIPSNDFGVSTPESVVLYPNEFLERGEFRASPGKKFRAGLSATGDFVLQDLQINPDKSPLLIWSAGTTGGTSLIMQTDGNLIVRDANRQGVWSTKTQNNPTAKLFIDDSGQIALKDGSNRLWLGGLPRDYYNHSKPTDLEFPIRGTFYYP